MSKVFVVGYIPTPEGEAAIEKAIAEATTHDATLVIVNTHRPGAQVDDRTLDSEDIAALSHRLTDASIRHEIIQPDVGHDAADLLLDEINQRKADAVIIGLRKRSPVGKLFFGSVAQRILLQADCDIIAVRAKSA